MTLGPLPWLEADIQRILPHRQPFLFVDRIVAIEPDRRVIGYRTWASVEALVTLPDSSHAVPAPYLTECMAQVGAVLILAKPENHGRLIYFLGIDRVRFRSVVRAGETLEVEAQVLRMRSRIGTLRGTARVGSRKVAEGAMTFALAGPAEAAA